MPHEPKRSQRPASPASARFIAPAAVRAAAARGLRWRRETGRGGYEVGIARARDLSNGRPITWETVLRMYSFFSRHQIDLIAEGASPGEAGFPSPGRVAWELWGGDPGFRWVASLKEKFQ